MKIRNITFDFTKNSKNCDFKYFQSNMQKYFKVAYIDLGES